MPPSGGSRTSLVELVARNPYDQRVNLAAFNASGVFSPGEPIAPPQSEQVRILDYRVGENRFWTPRSSERWSFQFLRNMADGHDLTRLAIETRKDQVERLDWSIRPIDKKKRNNASGDARITSVEAMVRFPDGETDFAAWTRAQMEDLFVLDAPAVEVRRNRGKDIIGFDVVDGSTFKVLIDDTGRTPKPPAPAFEQVIKGRPWALLTTDDLIYRPRNKRPGKLYGYGPVESIITTIHIALSRMLSQLNHFTEGNTPVGFINGPEGWTPEQLKTWYEGFVANMAGNLAERKRIQTVPAGATWQPIKDAPVKDEFDEWLARIVCYAFSLPPTPFIRQLNRSSAESADKSALDEGLEPIKSWIKRWWDHAVQVRLGHKDLEFAWLDDVDIEPATQSEIDDRGIRNGSMLINEVRDRHGFDPVPGGDRAYVYTQSGPVPLDDIAEGVFTPLPAEQQAEMQRQALDAKRTEANNEPAKGSEPQKTAAT